MVSASILQGRASILQENSGICGGQLFCARHHHLADVSGTPNSEEDKPLGPLWILLLGTVSIAWIVSFFRIFLFRKSAKLSRAAVAVVNKSSQAIPQRMTANVPNECFADLGGMDDAKDQIRQMVEAQLKPERSKRYGLSRNGILLYGPRGTGKTLLARAAAGEFGLNLVYTCRSCQSCAGT